jgi:hypothetical protein
MYQYIALASVLTILGTCAYKKLPMYYDGSIMDLVKSVLLVGIIVPVVEEIFFRDYLKYFLEYHHIELFGSSKWVNIILFGLAHLTNYVFIADKYDLFYHVCYTTFLGYVIMTHNTMVGYITTHVLANTVSLCYVNLLYNYNYNTPTKKYMRRFELIGTCVNTKTQDDFSISYDNKNKNMTIWESPMKCISYNKIKNDVVQMYMSFEEMKNKRNSRQ